MRPGLEVVVLAGGGGTRLWPLSRSGRPKFLLPLAGGASTLSRSISLARAVAGPGHAWVVAARELQGAIRSHLGGTSGVRMITEPAPRNTAAAAALATALVRKRTGAEWILCLPADQWIRRPAALARAVRRVLSSPPGEPLVTFGIPPAFAHPGYGYIEMGRRLAGAVWKARRFVEKPSAPRAARFVRSGRWVWNSGMFLWRAGAFLAEVERLLPRVARAVSEIVDGPSRSRSRDVRRWRALPPVSVDHGIMERTGRVAVVRADIGWQDLGTWEALAGALPAAADGTRHEGLYRSVGGGDCLVYAPGRLTFNLAVAGVGLAVTDDAILLFDRRQHERVRDVVAALGRERALRAFR